MLEFHQTRQNNGINFISTFCNYLHAEAFGNMNVDFYQIYLSSSYHFDYHLYDGIIYCIL